MMLGERIWGQSFIDELSRPHRDPEIRKTEEQWAELSHRMLLNFIMPESDPPRDTLPAHYRQIKIKAPK